MQAVLIALVVLVGILAAANLLLTLALARRLAEVERAAGPRAQPRMPRVGTEIGALSVETADGVRVSDAEIRSRRTLLVFSLAGCAPCLELAEELRRTDLPSGLGLLVLLAAHAGEVETLTVARYPAATQLVLLPDGSDLPDRFEVDAFPTLMLVEEGRITAVGRKPGEVLGALVAAAM